MSVALMDMNAFKALNDSQGHAAGDRLLQEAARSWQAELRPIDLLARLGGDEFAVILRNCGEKHGRNVAERLRRALPHPPGCGVGIARWNGREDAASLIRRADEALYADKATSAEARIRDAARIAAVAGTGITTDSQDDALDVLARTVTWLLDTPIGLISLVGADRLIVAAAEGLGDTREAPTTQSFCQHTVAMRRPLVISDTRESPVVAGNPAITELGVIAYAGIPLIDADGQALGSLCAIDVRPRDWSAEDIAVLTRLATLATDRLVELQQRGVAAPASVRATRAA